MKNNQAHLSFIRGLIFVVAQLLSVGTIAQRIADQPFQTKWGKIFEDDKKTFVQYLIGYDKTGFYALTDKYKGGDLTDGSSEIQYFNHDLTLQRSQPIKFKTGDKYETLESFIQLREDIYMFTSLADYKTRKQSMYVRKLNKRTLLPEQAVTKVAEIQMRKSVFREVTTGSFSIRTSRDSSHVMIFYQLPFKMGEPERFGVHVLDKHLREIWKKEISMPIPDQLFSMISMRVSNTGKVFVLGKHDKDQWRQKRNGKPNYEYKILVYGPGNDEGREYPLPADDRFLSQMTIAILDNGDIACAGFYSDEGLKSVRGTFFLRIDSASAQVVASTFKEFDNSFLTQNMKERQADRLMRKEERGGDVEIAAYQISDLVVRSDGGLILVAEQYTSTTITHGSGSSSYTTTSYFYGDIMVVNINPEGAIDWSALLPKNQATSEIGTFLFSYSLAVVGKNLYVMFNDDPKNIAFQMPGEPKLLKGFESSIIMVNKINDKGEVKRYPIFSTLGTDLTFLPRVSEKVSPNEMILFAKWKRDQQFIRITFE